MRVFLVIMERLQGSIAFDKVSVSFFFFFFFNFVSAMTINSFIYSFKCYFVTMACQNHSEDVDISVEDINLKLIAPSLHRVGCIKMYSSVYIQCIQYDI